MEPSGPVLGLALGSGSARGWAHLGVLHGLEELGVRPRVIAGCSVGAMVGAAWAARRLDPFETWVRSLTRRDVFGFLDVGFGAGLVKGERLFKLFERWSSLRIEKLPRRFASVATDLESGERLTFTEGPVVDAVRASMAMPGLLPPVLLDGRWLLDGALVDPIPVELCRQLGAERVIAVNLNHGIVRAKASRRLARQPSESITAEEVAELEAAAEEAAREVAGESEDEGVLARTLDQMNDRLEELKSWLAPRQELPTPGLYDVLVGALHILQDRVTTITLAQHPPDLELRPGLGDIGLLEVYRADEAIEEGRRVVLEAADTIRALVRPTSSASR